MTKEIEILKFKIEVWIIWDTGIVYCLTSKH
jgi:hypothetical protein